MNAESRNPNTRGHLNAAAGLPVTGKGDYRQNQFGGSFGGPILKDTAHFFLAVERTNQDKTQVVNTQGLFPTQDGEFAVPYRVTPFSGKVTANLNANQFLSVRYGHDKDTQPYGASPNSTFNNWGDSTNAYNSINVNHNWVLSGSKLNEFIFQFADFGNSILSRSSAPNESFPKARPAPTEHAADHGTAQVRRTISWHKSGGGLGHDLRSASTSSTSHTSHHVQHRQGRGVQPASPTTNGPMVTVMTATPREHPDEAVATYSRRLAHQRSTDVNPASAT